jgi:hypothetical protein
MEKIMKGININSVFHLSHLTTDHKAQKLLHTALDKKTLTTRENRDYLWPATRFSLQHSRFWRKLDPETQKNILILLSQRNLASSWWIENSGRSYGAKMILLAQSEEERSLHCLFTAEETIHMKEFENFMNFNLNWELHSHPMLNPLERVIKEGDRETLLLIVQVLLEGFGLAHYQGLSEDCLSPELKSAYSEILKDEARHHGTGIIFAQEMKPSPNSLDHMFEFSREFIHSFMNVTWIQTALETYTSPLSTKELHDLKEDLQTEKVNHTRCQRFKDMIQKVDHFGLVKRLEENKVF